MDINALSQIMNMMNSIKSNASHGDIASMLNMMSTLGSLDSELHSAAHRPVSSPDDIHSIVYRLSSEK